MQSVAFPALSEVARQRPRELKDMYYKFRMPIDILSFSAAGLLFSSGHFVVDMLYDDRYRGAGPIFEILCISLVAVPYSLAGHCFIALGKPQLLVPTPVVQVFVLYVFLPVALLGFGLTAALWAVGSASVAAAPIITYLMIRQGLFDLSREFRFLPFGVAGYLMGMFLELVLL